MARKSHAIVRLSVGIPLVLATVVISVGGVLRLGAQLAQFKQPATMYSPYQTGSNERNMRKSSYTAPDAPPQNGFWDQFAVPSDQGPLVPVENSAPSTTFDPSIYKMPKEYYQEHVDPTLGMGNELAMPVSVEDPIQPSDAYSKPGQKLEIPETDPVVEQPGGWQKFWEGIVGGTEEPQQELPMETIEDPVFEPTHPGPEEDPIARESVPEDEDEPLIPGLVSEFVPGDVIVVLQDDGDAVVESSTGLAPSININMNVDGRSAPAPVGKNLQSFIAEASEVKVIVEESPDAEPEAFLPLGPMPFSPTLQDATDGPAGDDVAKVMLVRFDGLDEEKTRAKVADMDQIPGVTAELNLILKINMVPNDRYYATTGAWGQTFRDLWGLPRIDAERAWDKSEGEGVVVAVIDTGVDYKHPDLAGNIWTNPGEIPDNGIDDDNNGFKDDYYGIDYADYDFDPMDKHGHGTHVAGTIAAVGNNAMGIIGVAHRAKIMSVRGLDANGSGSMDGLIGSIMYATDNGADVINASWGGFGFSEALRQAVNYAHAHGTTFVAAAGNSNARVTAENTMNFVPAGYRTAITVAASNEIDARSTFSNYGIKIDLAAPGGGNSLGQESTHKRSILSLLSSTAHNGMTGNGTLVVAGKYVRQAGTSMAAPHVAGVAALIKALHPDYSPEEVRQALRDGVDDIEGPGFDMYTGHGRLNAFKSLSDQRPLAAHLLTGERQADALNVFGTASGPGFSRWILEYGEGDTPTEWTEFANGASPVTNGRLATWQANDLPKGTYTLRLRVLGANGKEYSDRMEATADGGWYIASPQWPAYFDGKSPISIMGKVAPPSLLRYEFTATDHSNRVVPSERFTLPGGGTQPIASGLLATWNPQGLPEGQYTLRMKIHLRSGRTSEEETFVFIDPYPVTPPRAGWPKGVIGNRTLSSRQTQVIDLFGDGKKQVLAHGYLDVQVGGGYWIAVIDGQGNALPGWPKAVGHDPYGDAVAGDVNNDGTLEIAACESVNGKGHCHIWDAQGKLLPGWPQYMPQQGFQAPRLMMADVLGNGDKQLIVNEEFNSGFVIFRADGTIVQWPSQPAAITGTTAAVGDLDGDGAAELVTAQNFLLAYRGDGSLLWKKEEEDLGRPRGSAGGVQAVAIGDVDGDGALDVILAENRVSETQKACRYDKTTETVVMAFRGDGSLIPGWPAVIPDAGIANGLALGDMDGDGRAEIALSLWGNADSCARTNQALLIVLRGDGKQLPGWPIRHKSLVNIEWTSVIGYAPPIIADVDGDGRPEILANLYAGATNGKNLQAYRLDGSLLPGFAKKPIAITRRGAPAVADLDGDGWKEILNYASTDYGLHLWDTNARATAPAPWPMLLQNGAWTNTLLAPAATPSPPSPVRITFPRRSDTVRGIVRLAAEVASELEGATMTFFADGAQIGEPTLAPYAMDWDTKTVQDSRVILTAKATLPGGEPVSSDPVYVNVQNAAPTVSIMSPNNNAFLQGGGVRVTAGATGLPDAVEFFVDEKSIAKDPIAPFETVWQFEGDGTYTLIAKAIRGSEIVESAPVTVEVRMQPLSMQITNPQRDSVIRGNVTIAVDTRSTAEKVEFFLDNTLLGVDTSHPFAFALDTTTLPDSYYSIKAVVTHEPEQAHDNVPVWIRNAAASVAITSPALQANVKGTVPITAKVQGLVGARVEFSVDGALLDTAYESPYVVNWNSKTVDDGPHKLQAKAIWEGGGSTVREEYLSPEVTVNVGNFEISIQHPKNGMSSLQDIGFILANLSGPADTVELYVGTKLMHSMKPYFLSNGYAASVRWSPNEFLNGKYDIVAKAIRAGKPTISSAPISITVNIPGNDPNKCALPENEFFLSKAPPVTAGPFTFTPLDRKSQTVLPFMVDEGAYIPSSMTPDGRYILSMGNGTDMNLYIALLDRAQNQVIGLGKAPADILHPLRAAPPGIHSSECLTALATWQQITGPSIFMSADSSMIAFPWQTRCRMPDYNYVRLGEGIILHTRSNGSYAKMHRGDSLVAMSPNARYFVIGITDENKFVLYDRETNVERVLDSELFKWESYKRRKLIALSDDGREALFETDEGDHTGYTVKQFKIYDLHSQSWTNIRTPPGKRIWLFDFSADFSRFAFSMVEETSQPERYKTVSYLVERAGTVTPFFAGTPYEGHKGPISVLAMSDDGEKFLISGSISHVEKPGEAACYIRSIGHIWLYDRANGTFVFVTDKPWLFSFLHLSGNGSVVVSYENNYRQVGSIDLSQR